MISAHTPTTLVQVRHLQKSFHLKPALHDVSFDVFGGEVFGLLGPNGAGKTTTIRLMLDIFPADGGEISIFGGPLTQERRNRIGYMPEERGLYGDLKVIDCLVHFGKLKGLPGKIARQRAKAYLKRLELSEQEKSKIETLSRGMTQKVQVIAAVLHEPDLLIIDEPFANLDPINAQLVQKIILEIKARGGAVIITSHQLKLVEQLCDRIALINRGRVVIEGTVNAVRHRFARNLILINGYGQLNTDHPDVVQVRQFSNNEWSLDLQPDADPHQVLQTILSQADFTINRFEIALPSLDEIFFHVVQSRPTP